MKRKYYVALIAPYGGGIASGAELIKEFENLDEARATADTWQVEDEDTGNTSEDRWGVIDEEKKEVYVSF
jgi:hypothetical protein